MKIKNAILALAAAIAGAGPAIALAQGQPAAQQAAPTEGLYVGVSVAHATARDFCSDAALGAGGTKCDNKDTAPGFFAGWQFNRNLAVELGYRDLGKMQATVGGADRDIKFKAWEALGVGILPVGGVTSVYGKAGVFYGIANGGAAFAANEQKKARFTFGAGVQFDLSRSFAVRGEWQRYTALAGGTFGGKTDIGIVGLSGLYRF
jgi:OOP family OmpA-OmpF porin